MVFLNPYRAERRKFIMESHTEHQLKVNALWEKTIWQNVTLSKVSSSMDGSNIRSYIFTKTKKRTTWNAQQMPDEFSYSKWLDLFTDTSLGRTGEGVVLSRFKSVFSIEIVNKKQPSERSLNASNLNSMKYKSFSVTHTWHIMKARSAIHQSVYLNLSV